MKYSIHDLANVFVAVLLAIVATYFAWLIFIKVIKRLTNALIFSINFMTRHE